MAARDGAASVQGEIARITPLNVDGSIDETTPILTTEGFISASFGSEFEDGEEVTEKAANGKICIQYKADDSMKGITFNLSLCTPDPEASALIAGGKVICAAADVVDDGTTIIRKGDVVGYSSPAVGATVGNPVAIEIWSKAIINGKPAAGQPYWHWVFPYVRVRYDGDREFTNGALMNEFSGTGVGNDALVPTGLNPLNATDDFVTYKAALVNPFSYVRSAAKPAAAWTGAWTHTSTSAIGCVDETVASGATAGNPGTFTPSGATAPANLAALTSITASPTTAWTPGQHVVLGDNSHAYWDSDSWNVGDAP
jgi:uncharacterized Zn-binding protein involved in type VI secretion